MVPWFYFSQISNLKSPFRGFIFRKIFGPRFARGLKNLSVLPFKSLLLLKIPQKFRRASRGVLFFANLKSPISGFIFRKSQILNSIPGF